MCAFYCIQQNLPPLTAIVVGKRRGRAGDDIPLNLATIDSERERVYDFDWYDIYPPSESALAAAYTQSRAQASGT